MSVKTKAIPPFTKLPKTFEGLCRLFPPRPIRDEVDHDNTLEIVDVLAVNGSRLSKDQADYLDLLTTLVGAYEDEHHAIDLSHITPLQLLRSLVEDHQMTASDLGELLGNRSLGSKILRGEREMSKTHIRVLADRFKLNPSVFL